MAVFARDQEVVFDDALKQISFQVENRGGGEHEAALRVLGFAPRGACGQSVDGRTLAVPAENGEVKIPLQVGSPTRVTITRR